MLISLENNFPLPNERGCVGRKCSEQNDPSSPIKLLQPPMPPQLPQQAQQGGLVEARLVALGFIYNRSCVYVCM